MPSIIKKYESLSLHLTDNHTTTILSSSSSEYHIAALNSLTNSALTAQSTASRAKLGKPQRIIVEYPEHGATILTSYLDAPKPAQDTSDDSTVDGSSLSTREPERGRELSRPGTAGEGDAPPTVVGIVVGSTEKEEEALKEKASKEKKDEAWVQKETEILIAAKKAEALKAAERLERVGREFQKVCARENEQDGTSEDS